MLVRSFPALGVALAILGCTPGVPSDSTPSSNTATSAGESSTSMADGTGGTGVRPLQTGTTTSFTSTSGPDPSGTDDGVTTETPPQFDVGTIPDMPNGPCGASCPPDEYCSYCGGLQPSSSCRPFPEECQDTPTCKCINAVDDGQCEINRDGLLLHKSNNCGEVPR